MFMLNVCNARGLMMPYFKPKLVACWLNGPINVWLCTTDYVKYEWRITFTWLCVQWKIICTFVKYTSCGNAPLDKLSHKHPVLRHHPHSQTPSLLGDTFHQRSEILLWDTFSLCFETQSVFSRHLQSVFFPSYDKVFHSYKTRGKMTVPLF
jgi:hypothetical protein